jgi:hypothetical protein
MKSNNSGWLLNQYLWKQNANSRPINMPANYRDDNLDDKMMEM